MSSQAQKLKKTIIKNKLTFPVEMYNTLSGSIVVCAYIFTEDKDKFPLAEVKATWRKIQRHPDKYTFDITKDTWIDDILTVFGLKRPEFFQVAMVQSEYSMLIAPYAIIDTEEGSEVAVLPLREDGFKGPTLKHGKVYPLNFKDVA